MTTRHIYPPPATVAAQHQETESGVETICVHAAAGDRIIVDSISQGSTVGGTATHPGSWITFQMESGGAQEWHITGVVNENLWTFT